jgi:hypothetical protein
LLSVDRVLDDVVLLSGCNVKLFLITHLLNQIVQCTNKLLAVLSLFKALFKILKACDVF